MPRPVSTGGYQVVITDFDGTVVKEDIALLVLRKYGLPGWQAYDEQLESGRISLEDCLASQYSMVRAPSEQAVIRFARRHYKLRDGFVQFVESCEKRGTEVVIVSAGLDFCILDAMKRARLEVDRIICPKSSFSPDGIRVDFPRFGEDARNFKEAAVVQYKGTGKRCVFVGDGYSDFYPATRADVVFAVKGSVLEKKCRENGAGYSSFTKFRRVEELLR